VDDLRRGAEVTEPLVHRLEDHAGRDKDVVDEFGCVTSRPPAEDEIEVRLSAAGTPSWATTQWLVCEAARCYGNADNASVNNATSASCCTSADDHTSSEPSSALAASPALLSISSAILVSMVCAAMMRHAVTGSV
jgi:hypothetical protein